jgi:CspA family cold shock protein
MARETGNVKWFSNEKGYGFIERQSGEDVFVHHSDIEGEGFKTLREGEEVEFEVISAEKGPKALNVVPESAEESVASTARSESRATSPRANGGGETPAEDGAGDDGRSLASQLREKLGGRFFGETS